MIPFRAPRRARGAPVAPRGRRVFTATRLARVMATAGLAMTTIAGALGAQTAPFPQVDRPVAPIVTPAYSTEAARDAHGEANRVMDRLGIKPGMRVADVGAGDGYYTVRLAKRVAPSGVVYAEDVTGPYLDHLAERIAREHLADVTLVRGLPADPRLPEKSVDVALLAHMYHEVQQPYEFLYRLGSALALGARVAIIDNDKPTGEHGTPPDLLRCELGAVGYREIDFLWLAPADGYLAVFAAPAVLPRPDSIRPCRR